MNNATEPEDSKRSEMYTEKPDSLLLNIDIFSAEFDEEDETAVASFEDTYLNPGPVLEGTPGASSSANSAEEDPEFRLDIDESKKVSHIYQVKREFNDYMRTRSPELSVGMKRERTSLARNVGTEEITKKPLQSTRVILESSKTVARRGLPRTMGISEKQRKLSKSTSPAKSSLASQAPRTQLDIQAIKVKQVKRPKLLRLLDHAKDKLMSVQVKSSPKTKAILDDKSLNSLIAKKNEFRMVQAPNEVKMKMFPDKKHQDWEQSTTVMSLSGLEKRRNNRMQMGCIWDE